MREKCIYRILKENVRETITLFQEIASFLLAIDAKYGFVLD